MIKEIEVNIQEISADGETQYFKLSATATGKDLGVAFMLSVRRRHSLSFKIDNI